MENELSKRLIEGLKKYNLTLDEIKNSGWNYCGGDVHSCHTNYWKLRFNDMKFPPHEAHCVCGHFIRENCYITNNNTNFVIIGNCCIKKFLPKDKQRRTCSICQKPHRNRVVNKCNSCRKGKCDKCEGTTYKRYKLCYSCKY